LCLATEWQPHHLTVSPHDAKEIPVSHALGTSSTTAKPFLTDVKTLRERARKNLSEGVVTTTYGGDAKRTIEILQSVLATEIVCVLRYTMHAVTATGISSEAIKAEFAQHAKEEQQHMMAVAVDHYRELIRYFGDDDPATRIMLNGILTVEEEHATDMLDLLQAHEGKPPLG
jgi:bacterioferritin